MRELGNTYGRVFDFRECATSSQVRIYKHFVWAEDFGERDSQRLREFDRFGAVVAGEPAIHNRVDFVGVALRFPADVLPAELGVADQHLKKLRIPHVSMRVDPTVAAGPHRRWIELPRVDVREAIANPVRFLSGEVVPTGSGTAEERGRFNGRCIHELPLASSLYPKQSSHGTGGRMEPSMVLRLVAVRLEGFSVGIASEVEVASQCKCHEFGACVVAQRTVHAEIANGADKQVSFERVKRLPIEAQLPCTKVGIAGDDDCRP